MAANPGTAAVAATPSASFAPEVPLDGKSIKALTMLHLKRSFDMYAGNRAQSQPIPMDEERYAPPGYTMSPG